MNKHGRVLDLDLGALNLSVCTMDWHCDVEQQTHQGD